LKNKHHIGGVTDLVIMNFLEGLYVPDLSIPLDSIPPWNEKNPHFLMFYFPFEAPLSTMMELVSSLTLMI